MITHKYDNSLEKLIELKYYIYEDSFYNKRIPIRTKGKEEMQGEIWEVYKHGTLVSISCGVMDDVTSS